MSFINTRLLDCVSYGTECGPTWSTRKVTLNNGHTRRNPRRSRPLYVATVLFRALKEEDHQAVIAAFNACMGGLNSFRFKDWSDFEVANEVLPVLGTGAAQQVQLTKTYTFGSTTVVRPIRKPVSGTVVMTANDSPLAATVDYSTGIATFTATASAVLRWSGEFDIPMMFRDDALPLQAISRNADGLMLAGDVALEEDLSV
jgi:uncharacterized protein (TIGR02217 family)